MAKQTWRDLGEDKEVVKRDNNVLNKWSKWKVESHYHQLCEHGTTWHDIQAAEKVCQLGGFGSVVLKKYLACSWYQH